MSAVGFNFKDLPISERIQLVEDIWDSIAEETPEGLELLSAERAELHRRYAAHQADLSGSIPWGAGASCSVQEQKRGLVQLVFRPEAQAELLEAQAWYERLEIVVVSCFHHRRTPGAWLRNA